MTEKIEPNDKIEKKHYKDRVSSDIIQVPQPFRRNTLSASKDSTILSAPLNATRIIFKIINDISYDQIVPKKQPQQFSLFDEEFLTEDNTYARFTFHIKEIDEHTNYVAMKKALDWLAEYRKGWHKSTNSKGKVVSSRGGLISNPVISEGKITFLVSSYFLSELKMLEPYNTAFYKIPWKLNSTKQVMMYLWLLELKLPGTEVKLETFQETYGYNYSTAKAFAQNVLKPLRESLNRYSNRSFNYSVKKNKISIVPYETKDVELKLKEKTITKQKITQRLNYWKQRHDLTADNIKLMRTYIKSDATIFTLLEKSYKSLVKKCALEKIKMTQYKGKKFIDVFQREIDENYKLSAWSKVSKNSCPKLSSSK